MPTHNQATSNVAALAAFVMVLHRFRHKLSSERVLLGILLVHAIRQSSSLFVREGIAGLYKRLVGEVLHLSTRALPGVASVVAKEVDSTLDGIEKDLLGDGDAMALMTMPPIGRPAAEVEAVAAEMVASEISKAAGKKWAGIYHAGGNSLARMQGNVWAKFVDTNALYPTIFPSLRKFEAEIVSMTLDLVHGHQVGACGLLTSGGTESILLAALAYREQGRERG